MSKSDQWIVFILSLFILLQVTVLIAGKIRGELIASVGILNLFVAALFIGYWIVRYFQVQVHIFDLWITLLLMAETGLILLTVYSVIVHYNHPILRFMQYFLFGFHLVASILFLVFMLSFKMNRLF
jgi:hypothetical protein